MLIFILLVFAQKQYSAWPVMSVNDEAAKEDEMQYASIAISDEEMKEK